jgi:hypothetical protein
MIVNENGGSVLGGMGTLFRIHGSAAYKVVLPALGSTALLIAYDFISFSGRTIYIQRHFNDDDRTIVQHPFAIGAFIAFFRYQYNENGLDGSCLVFGDTLDSCDQFLHINLPLFLPV